MKKNWMLKGLKIVFIVVLAGAVVGLVIEGLWNWLMPSLFGLHQVTFWQALGLLVFCKLLFGGFHRHSSHRRCWKRGVKERLENMAPEEREKFREIMRECCSRRDVATVDSNR
jgi:hypothetical protein